MDTRRTLIELRTMVVFSARKLILNRRWILVLAVAVLVGALMGYSATLEVDHLSFASDLLNLLFLTFFLPIFALIYGASMIRNEIDDRSIVQVITSPMDRRASFIGYFLALTIVLSLMIVITAIVGWSSYFIVAGISLDAVDLLLPYLLVLVLGSVAYSSIFLTSGVILRQPIYLGLFYIFIWEGFVGSIPGAIADMTVRHQLQVIASHWIEYGDISYVTGDALVSAMALVVLTIIMVLIGAFAFREKEIS